MTKLHAAALLAALASPATAVAADIVLTPGSQIGTRAPARQASGGCVVLKPWNQIGETLPGCRAPRSRAR